jgi:hypothetical protein
MLCIIALILLLPHSSLSKIGKHGGQPILNPNGTVNITNPSTTIGESSVTTVGPTSVNTTTITSGNLTTITTPFNYSDYVNQLLNPYNATTTTILYVYCVGSPLPSFNQSYFAPLNVAGAGSWKLTTKYPIPFVDGSCASTGSAVYCVGDSSILFRNHMKAAYYAGISDFGIGNWSSTSSYPIPFSLGSCSAYNGYVYCVGTSNQSDSQDVFYAPILPSGGVGTWSQTTSYPKPFFGSQCNPYNGYLYCVGDSYIDTAALESYYRSLNGIVTPNTVVDSQGLPPINASLDYYAPISSSGVGQWKRITTTPVPIDGGSCTISNETIYCIGGASTSQLFGQLEANSSLVNATAYANAIEPYLTNAFNNQTSLAFYAQINKNGSVSNWTYTDPYPGQLQNTECTSNGSNIYCVGGSGPSSSQQAVYYSALSPSFGIQAWFQTTQYPIPFYSGYCSTNQKS